jgi:hypothetical protein
MTQHFDDRLNQVLPCLLSADVLDNRGAGGEIGFWIFDYPAVPEMVMRQWLSHECFAYFKKDRLQQSIDYSILQQSNNVLCDGGPVIADKFRTQENPPLAHNSSEYLAARAIQNAKTKLASNTAKISWKF